MAELANACPVAALKPFLARAAEFDARQPVVAYYLRMHAVNGLMTAPRTPELKSFLIKLLDFVESQKARIKLELEATDGRVALTKTALMLFTMADDTERATAAPSEKALKLFYTSSVLLEATAQFNEGKMDPLATEKHKYARYVAGLMKKSLTEGAPYESPSGGLEAAALENLPAVPPPAGQPLAPAPNHYQPQPAAPPQSWQQPSPSQSGESWNAQPTPQQPPPQQQPWQQPQQAPQHAYQPQQASSRPPPPIPVTQPMPSPQPQQPRNMSGKDAKVKADRVIAAEKHARQAIAALQFFDENTARAQLHAALAALGEP
jgi:vacuolar protein sorting-associated protein VTA1